MVKKEYVNFTKIFNHFFFQTDCVFETIFRKNTSRSRFALSKFKLSSLAKAITRE